MSTVTVTAPAAIGEFNVKPEIKTTVHAIPPVLVHDTPVLNVLDPSKTYGDFRDGEYL